MQTVNWGVRCIAEYQRLEEAGHAFIIVRESISTP
jgi:hypothetical protein